MGRRTKYRFVGAYSIRSRSFRGEYVDDWACELSCFPFVVLPALCKDAPGLTMFWSRTSDRIVAGLAEAEGKGCSLDDLKQAVAPIAIYPLWQTIRQFDLCRRGFAVDTVIALYRCFVYVGVPTDVLSTRPALIFVGPHRRLWDVSELDRRRMFGGRIKVIGRVIA